METRKLGQTGLQVAEIGIGCWPIGGLHWDLGREAGWGGVNDREAISGIRRALSLGADLFDTADSYGGGRSERLLGQAIEGVAPRDSMVLCTKTGYHEGDCPHPYHPAHLRHQVEKSLHHLRTDYVDVFSFHHHDFGVSDAYLEPALETMLRLKEEGKLRFIGLRGPHRHMVRQEPDVDTWQRFLVLAQIIRPAVVQVRYNALSPTFDRPETDIFAWADAGGVGILINKPLAQGLLLDKYRADAPPTFEPGDHRRRKRWFTPEGYAVLHRRLSKIKGRFGCTTEALARVAIQYCLARDPNACVLVGFTSVAQVETNLRVSGRPLKPQEIAFVRDALAGIQQELGEYHATGTQL